MATLTERLEEVMRAMHWEYPDLMRITRQSHSVVSQWLGRGSKEIKTIGKMEAAIYIERASGFSALWVAKGLGPKRVTPHLKLADGGELPPMYSDSDVLERMGMLLAALPPATRKPFADLLHGWALDGGTEDRRPYLLALLQPIEKRHGT